MSTPSYRCAACGRSYASGEVFCPIDGHRLQPEGRLSPEDGEETMERLPRRATPPPPPPPAAGIPRLVSQRADPQDPWIGQIIGNRYRILAFLGAGGMASVYVARHEMLGRVLALKLLRHNLPTSSHAVERFRREAQTVSRINHENVVYLTDFGETPDGTLYMVMEYLAGRTLAEILHKEGRLEPARAVGIALQMARALEAAHAAGVIHRDLKPENVMLLDPGTVEEKVKILDFGIAKLADPENEQERLTRAGTVFGTPEYMSPEQAMGVELDGRTDLYSLGLILWEMLAGRRLFQGRSAPETLSLQVTAPALPPSGQAPPGTVPEPLDRLVLLLLAKKPDARFASARALVRELVALRAAWRGLPAAEVATTSTLLRDRQLAAPPPLLRRAATPPPPPADIPVTAVAPPPPLAPVLPQPGSGVRGSAAPGPPPVRAGISEATTRILVDEDERRELAQALARATEPPPAPPPAREVRAGTPAAAASAGPPPVGPREPAAGTPLAEGRELATARRRYRDLLLALARRIWPGEVPPEVAQARREVARIEETLLDQATDVSLLTDDLQELIGKREREEDRIRLQIADAETRIATLVRELAPKLRDREERLLQLQELEREESQLTRRLRELESTLGEAEGETVGASDPEVGQTFARLALLATTRDHLRDELSTLTSGLEGLQQEIGRLRSDQASLSRRLEEVRQTARQQQTRLEEALHRHEEEMERLQRSLAPHLTTLLIRIQALRSSLPSLQEIFAELDRLRAHLGHG
ncbi:MAG: protein kinase [Myxococcota bacterium]|jgi:serine/threonine-protein kinase|nr:protein kinase [Myxococcota bacterium]